VPLDVYELLQEQRSVHDPIPPRELRRALDDFEQEVELLSEPFRRNEGVDLSTALAHGGQRLPSLRRAVEQIQRWKTAVGFDPHPDDDDGEWTMRVLERLYRLAWVV
jgi:hypothetical protein